MVYGSNGSVARVQVDGGDGAPEGAGALLRQRRRLARGMPHPKSETTHETIQVRDPEHIGAIVFEVMFEGLVRGC